jgi:hypothetical protein
VRLPPDVIFERNAKRQKVEIAKKEKSKNEQSCEAEIAKLFQVEKLFEASQKQIQMASASFL